jgi:hypothetical protein
MLGAKSGDRTALAGGILVAQAEAKAPAEVGPAYVDIDEWREQPRPHRYVHGGFEDSHTRFSFYFPPKDLYRGRFYQYLEGGAGGHEHMLPMTRWAYAVAFEDLGGYLVESNQGHFPDEGTGFSDDWELFGASAESALFAKQLATEMYGEAPRHGYVWDGSGGGSRSIYCLENRPDVYDGAAPHVIWSSPLGSIWQPIGYWWLHAHNKLPQIIDAMEPGGSGDPFAGLTVDEREALAALYRFGFPRGAESQLWAFSPWTWGFVNTLESDPGYYRDFWDKPGYLGHDDPDRLARLVIQQATTIKRTVGAEALADIAILAATAGAPPTDTGYGVVLEAAFEDPEALFGATLTFTSGKAKGRRVVISRVASGAVLGTSGEHAPDFFRGVEVGDEVIVDNRDFVAWCHMFLHGLSLDLITRTDPETGEARYLEGFEGLSAWAVDDRALFPQRKARLVPQEGGGTGHSGRFKGKMIHVNATHDAQVWPNGVVVYKAKVRSDKGAAIGDSYRLWWVENAPHGAPQILGPALTPLKDPGVWASRLVDYDGVTAQALRDLTAWVEDGAAPPADTAYRMGGDGDIRLEQDAGQRRGVQPTASATANDGSRAEVKVGESVRLIGRAAQPPGTGTIVAAEWDFEGKGAFVRQAVPGDTEDVVVEAVHAYDAPGTYFASFRVGSHRDGRNGRPPFARNNARVRIVVTD